MRALLDYLFGGGPRHPSRYRAMETFGIVAFSGFVVLLVRELWIGRHVAGADWRLIPMIMLAFLGADFVSGAVHWLADNFGTEKTWFFGPKFVFHFREHHRDPKGITRHDFIETNGDNCLVCLPALGLALWLLPARSASWGFYAGVFLVALVVFVLATNQIHKWSHMDQPPWLVRQLQRVHLILTPAHHDVHHTPPHDRYYCITNGWLNPVLEMLRFWDFAEWCLGLVAISPTSPHKKRA